ncbi:hypothetical protein E5Q_05444 [Mixia osmundae IAM 14324]|uniref:Uncharacterized protein n=1 Tax=Mixia osmundae (strain CBS 9802 / IAM 14324 / JCM 22182 / KY 12970) TaxID=764103 RepID=G7E7E6_MIXOS|nr:hypothetical protein E5Q_05444 [Mixia osmundae IAM 14324]
MSEWLQQIGIQKPVKVLVSDHDDDANTVTITITTQAHLDGKFLSPCCSGDYTTSVVLSYDSWRWQAATPPTREVDMRCYSSVPTSAMCKPFRIRVKEASACYVISNNLSVRES